MTRPLRLVIAAVVSAMIAVAIVRWGSTNKDETVVRPATNLEGRDVGPATVRIVGPGAH